MKINRGNNDWRERGLLVADLPGSPEIPEKSIHQLISDFPMFPRSQGLHDNYFDLDFLPDSLLFMTNLNFVLDYQLLIIHIFYVCYVLFFI